MEMNLLELQNLYLTRCGQIFVINYLLLPLIIFNDFMLIYNKRNGCIIGYYWVAIHVSISKQYFLQPFLNTLRRKINA
jgi:hypothetical protein